MTSTSTALTVQWRRNTYHFSVTACTTVGELKAELQKLTQVPHSKQKLLYPDVGELGRLGDSYVLHRILPQNGIAPKPVTLIGTPVAEISRVPEQEQLETEIQNDLHELQSTSHLIEDDFAGRKFDERFITPRYNTPFSRRRRAHQGPIETHIEPVETDEEDSDIDLQREQQQQVTNGALPRLEAIDEALAGACCGPAFSTKHGARSVQSGNSTELLSAGATTNDTIISTVPTARFMEAVRHSKRDLKMLAVLLINSESEQYNRPSNQFVQHILKNEHVRRTLEESFLLFPADLSPLEDGGSSLLSRVGLHALPAMLILADVGSGVTVVDMFGGDWFGPLQNEDTVLRLSIHLQEILNTFDNFYEISRATRAVSEERGQILREQDEAFAAAANADRQVAMDEAQRVERERSLEETEKIARRTHQAEMQEAANALPEEPNQGTRVAVRLADGERIQRKFNDTDTLKDIVNWCIANGCKKGAFSLVTSFPKRKLCLDQQDKTLLDLGLVPSAVLTVDTTAD